MNISVAQRYAAVFTLITFKLNCQFAFSARHTTTGPYMTRLLVCVDPALPTRCARSPPSVQKHRIGSPPVSFYRQFYR